MLRISCLIPSLTQTAAITSICAQTSERKLFTTWYPITFLDTDIMATADGWFVQSTLSDLVSQHIYYHLNVGNHHDPYR